MLSLKAHAAITASLFAAMVLGAIGGNILHDGGLLADGSAVQLAAKVIFFGLFLGFGYSAIPLMVKLFLAGQGAIGNADLEAIKAIRRRERTVVFAFWVLITLGLVIAIPAAIMDGFFDTDPAAEIAATPSRGTVVARPGMTVDEIKRLSSLPLKGAPDTVFADGNLFDFEIAGTSIRFPRCRYYFMTTSSKDRTRIANISVGTAQSKMSRAKLAAADAALRERLVADGWLMAYDKTRTEQERRFHGGLAGAANNAMWANGDIVLRILSRRIDDAKPGEPAEAGEWIQFVELASRKDYSGIERYEFAKPQ